MIGQPFCVLDALTETRGIKETKRSERLTHLFGTGATLEHFQDAGNFPEELRI